jgi:hypothetical protein
MTKNKHNTVSFDTMHGLAQLCCTVGLPIIPTAQRLANASALREL